MVALELSVVCGVEDRDVDVDDGVRVLSFLYFATFFVRVEEPG